MGKPKKLTSRKQFSEKDRSYRLKLKEDPVRYAAYLQRERERYKQKKEKKQIKLIADLNDREKRQRRKSWRKAQRCHRSQSTVNQLTPPNSPDSPGASGNVFNFNNVARGRKRVRKDRSAMYRKMKKMERELESKSKLAERYKKQLYRLRKESVTPGPETPRSKTARLLGRRPVSSKVKKTLIFHYSLSSEIIKRLKSRKTSRNIVQIFRSKIMSKYKLKSFVKQSFGIKKVPKRKKKKHCVVWLQNQIQEFLERDDSSRLCAGKKETITKYKNKKQRRYLVDTLKNLHVKFLAESNFVCSYSLFCRLRPFWVLKPDLSQRETCICQIHDNLLFKSMALKNRNVINTSDIDQLVSQICCDVDNKSCMYRECINCKDRTIRTELNENDQQEFVKWCKWSKMSEAREKRNADGSMKDYTAVFTAKITQESRIWELLEDFNTDLQRGCKHVFNIKQQYKEIRRLKNNLGDTNCLIHMDFSENFGCKYHACVQSVHFGASHHQATLHTSVLYTASNTIPICTISDSGRKDPEAIWAHLKPVLEMVKEDFDGITTVHFLSDGPSGQYKNKTNMAMFSKKIFDYEFVGGGSWNYLETSHGKGAPDGIGAVIKRTADRLIAENIDIPEPRKLFDVLKDKTKVKLFFIEGNNIEHDTTFDTVPAVKGTMGIHQIITRNPGILTVRDVSCFCKDLDCQCFNPRKVSLLQFAQTSETSATPSTASSNQTDSEAIQIDDNLIGQWCIVEYYDHFYPGIIKDVDDNDIEVTAMSCAGRNKYFWPRMEDRIWYNQSKIIKLNIPEPEPVTGRHFQIRPDIYLTIAPKYEQFTQ